MKALPRCVSRGKKVGAKYECSNTEVNKPVVEVSQCLICPFSDKPLKANHYILNCELPPGDQLTLTAAVESLHLSFPGKYVTGIDSTCPDIWENNPHITKLAKTEAPVLKMMYNLVHESNQSSVVFLEGYTADLGKHLGISLRLKTNRPHVYLTDEEKSWTNQVQQYVTGGRNIPFWLINAGIKNDYTAKAWPVESYQAVVDAMRGKIQFVQIGSKWDSHPDLRGVINFVGKTTMRELLRLAYHARGGVGPVTFLQHLCAAFEKPYICIAGGREPLPWITSYPKQTTLHTIGALPCCENSACWRSRIVPLGDSSHRDNELCVLPVFGLERPVAKCMAMIQPSEVVSVLNRYN